MKKALLLSSDQALSAAISSGLSGVMSLDTDRDILSVADKMSRKSFDVLVIDSEGTENGGIEAYKTIKNSAPRVKAVMLSKKGEVSEAVEATKLGVNDFLPKPLDPAKLLSSLQKVLREEFYPGGLLRPAEGGEWLEGLSPRLQDLTRNIEEVSRSDNDLIIVGSYGMPKRYLAEMVHMNGHNRDKKFVELKLSIFEKESSESMFWTALKELLSEQPHQTKKDEQCGTLFLDDFDALPAHFEHSILDFLAKRSAQGIDKTVRVVLAVNNDALLERYADKGTADKFLKLFIPKLKDRKEDIPSIADSMLRYSCDKFGKDIKGISSDVIAFFMMHDWPGDYIEMARLIDAAVLNARAQYASMKDFPVGREMFISSALKAILARGDWTLSTAVDSFERQLLNMLLEISGGSVDDVSRLIDMPKTSLEEMMHKLGIGVRQDI